MLSAASAFVLVWEITASGGVAFLGALAYATFPYRFVNVFARGALAEAWVFVAFPMIVAGAVVALRDPRAPPWGGVLALLFAVQTHTITTLYLLVALLPIAWSLGARPVRREVWVLASTGVLAVGTGAWFLLPQQLYIGEVWVSDPVAMLTDRATVLSHAVPMSTLLTGYPALDEMRLSLGAAGWLFPLIVVMTRWRGVLPPHQAPFVFTCLGMWAVAVVVQAVPALFCSWAPPRAFLYLQFPWRLQGIAGLCMVIGGSVCVTALLRQRHHALAIPVIALGLIALIPVSVRRATVIPSWTDAFSRATGNPGFTCVD